jgi:hypothetical protein
VVTSGDPAISTPRRPRRLVRAVDAMPVSPRVRVGHPSVRAGGAPGSVAEQTNCTRAAAPPRAAGGQDILAIGGVPVGGKVGWTIARTDAWLGGRRRCVDAFQRVSQSPGPACR